jgi:hypothetical protein
MFEFRCVNTKNWKLKIVCEMFRIWNFENWNVWIGMFEYLKLKTEIWNLKSLCETFGIWKFEN